MTETEERSCDGRKHKSKGKQITRLKKKLLKSIVRVIQKRK